MTRPRVTTGMLLSRRWRFRESNKKKFVNLPILDAAHSRRRSIFDLGQNLRFCKTVSSDYLVFILGEKEKVFLLPTVFPLQVSWRDGGFN